MLETLQSILAWGIIIAIAIVYFRPIALNFALAHRNRVGLPVSATLEEIEILLRQNPWKEKQELNFVDQGEASIILTGQYTSIRLLKRDGNLIGWGFPINSKGSFRQNYWASYETDQVLQYISCLDKNKGNEEATKFKEQASLVLSKKKNQEKRLKWLGRIFIIIMLGVMAWVLFYAKSQTELPSAIAQNIVFTDFHYTKTIGTALHAFDPDGEWFDISDKNALKNNGVAYAGWRGTSQRSGYFITPENWDLIIYFEVEKIDNDRYYVSVDRIDFGSYTLERFNLLGNNTISEVMNVVYGNQQSASVMMNTGLYSETCFLSKKMTSPSVTTSGTMQESGSATNPAYGQNCEGEYGNESIYLYLETLPNQNSYSCELYWYFGKFLETGIIQLNTTCGLDGGTQITVRPVSDGKISVTLQGEDFFYENIELTCWAD